MNSVEVKYVKAFSNLRRATKNGIKAPHKPILLLSILDQIALGEIKENKIKITPQLVAQFKDYWNVLVNDIHFKANFSLPFFHLQSDKFWHLSTLPGKEILLTSSHSIKSFSQICEAIDYGYFNDDLFQLIMNPNSLYNLRSFILDFYFGKKFDLIPNKLFEKIEIEILEEPSEKYKKTIEQSDEEELFIRSGVFKKTIPNVYNQTCSITRLRIISGFDIQMIDACHIVPFSISHDDTIHNGLSLSPTFHRAFDRGLITVDTNFRIVVSDNFSETGSEVSFKNYHGQKIHLPNKSKYYPSLENLRWHNQHVFKG